jgi:hypothetical protein
VAVAWKAPFGKTDSRARELLQSGNVMWGLDDEEEVFGLYGVPYQPVSILVTHDKIIRTGWVGALGEVKLRAELDALLATAP